MEDGQVDGSVLEYYRRSGFKLQGPFDMDQLPQWNFGQGKISRMFLVDTLDGSKWLLIFQIAFGL